MDLRSHTPMAVLTFEGNCFSCFRRVTLKDFVELLGMAKLLARVILEEKHCFTVSVHL